MATTTHGLPYPTGTDRVMDGDDAIKALAEQLDTELTKRASTQHGTLSIPALAAGVSTATLPVTFPRAFTAAPSVVVQTGNGRVGFAVVTPTASGFSYVATNNSATSAGAFTALWIAAGDQWT